MDQDTYAELQNMHMNHLLEMKQQDYENEYYD